jgi:hypothetical protein
MPVQGILSVFDGITTGLLLLGGGAVTLTLAAAGLCTMFAWMDMHIGGFVKKVFSSVMLGGSMMAGSGGFGHWLASQFGLSSGGAAAAPAAGMILGLFGWM